MPAAKPKPADAKPVPVKTERQKKTPEQRATEALGTAERVYARLEAAIAHQRQLLTATGVERDAARARLAYVGIHPDLPEAERQRVANMLANPEPPANA